MTPFKKNITKSIDNLNRICKTILSVYDNKMLSDNVLNQSGSDLSFNNTVAGGKFDWEIQGKCEQDTTSISDGDEYDSPTPEHPQPIRVVTGNNDVVVQNKNLLGLVNGTYYGTNVTANVNNGIITLNGTTSTTEFIYIPKIGPIIKENFTISANNPVANNEVIIRLADTYPQYDIRLSDVNQTSTKTYVSSAPLNKNRIVLRISSGITLTNFVIQPQIELGSTATSYVPHAEQKVTLHLGSEYLAGIGDYKDEIVGKTDDWKIVRNVGKLVLDGTETYGVLGGYDLYCQKSLNKYFNVNENTVISNMLQPSNNTEIWSKRNQTGNNLIGASSDGFRIMMNDYNDSEVLKAEILRLYNANTPLYAYYRLNTPTEETITDITLISDLNNMYNARGYDGQTNISIVPAVGNATPSLKVTAFVTEKEV